MPRVETMQQKLEKIVPKYIAGFIIWYYSPEDKRISFEQLSKRYVNNIKNLDECIEWLSREDAQEAVIAYKKYMHKLKMMEIYDTMVNKALEGNVNAAKWCEDFTKSDFFDDSTDEINDFLNSVKLPKKE